MSARAKFEILTRTETRPEANKDITQFQCVQFVETKTQPPVVLEWRQAGLFGPRTEWSALLDQREHLQKEIHHGRKYLQRLRKDLGDWSALAEAQTAQQTSGGAVSAPEFTGSAVMDGNMEQFLLGWLDRLEARLGSVVRDLEAFAPQKSVEPSDHEESILSLLRAAH
jgi:hypothetical protein